MFVVGNLLTAFAELLGLALMIYQWILFFRVIFSWVSADAYNPIVQFCYRVTEPLLEPLRRFLPYSAIDFSPMLLWFFLEFFGKRFLLPSLYELALRLR